MTGVSTGIGRSIAEDLLVDSRYQVIAVARDEQSLDEFKLKGAFVVKADLANESDRFSLGQQVTDYLSSDPTRWSEVHLINNAGLVRAGPLELIPVEDWKYEFEVNFFAVVHLTQLLLPMLRVHSGKLINMSSISGRMSLPFLGAYSASKFALEAMSDSLRRELPDTNIDVVLIEPGTINTPIWKKSSDWTQAALKSSSNQSVYSLYSAMIDKMLRYSQSRNQSGLSPSEISKLVKKILRKKRVRARYAIGPGSFWRAQFSRLLPTKLVDALVSIALGK